MQEVRWETVWLAAGEPNAVCLRLSPVFEPVKQAKKIYFIVASTVPCWYSKTKSLMCWATNMWGILTILCCGSLSLGGARRIMQCWRLVQAAVCNTSTLNCTVSPASESHLYLVTSGPMNQALIMITVYSTSCAQLSYLVLETVNLSL